MKKLVHGFFVAIFLLAASSIFAAAQEESSEGAGGEDIFATVMVIAGKFDMVHNAAIMWWTDEVWSVLAYGDKSREGILGYHVMSVILRDHLLFSPLDLSGGGNMPVFTDVSLVNDKGVKVKPVMADASLDEMMPGALVFPRKDTLGRELVDKDTQKVTAVVRYEGEETDTEYDWNLPLAWPEVTGKAKAWIEARKNLKREEISEDEYVLMMLQGQMQFDITSGVIVAPMTSALFDMFLEKDPEIIADPSIKPQVKALISLYDIFIVMGLDSEKNPGRVGKIAANAYGVNSKGETVKLKPGESDAFMKQLGNPPDEGFTLVAVPNLGQKGDVALVFEIPETNQQISFKWKR